MVLYSFSRIFLLFITFSALFLPNKLFAMHSETRGGVESDSRKKPRPQKRKAEDPSQQKITKFFSNRSFPETPSTSPSRETTLSSKQISPSGTPMKIFSTYSSTSNQLFWSRNSTLLSPNPFPSTSLPRDLSSVTVISARIAPNLSDQTPQLLTRISPVSSLNPHSFAGVSPPIAPPSSLSNQTSARASSPRSKSDYQIEFIRGNESHITEIVNLIEGAEQTILIACWNLNFIPSELLSALRSAQRREVSISFFVHDIKNEIAESYFFDDSEDGEGAMCLMKTNTHAKFVIVDEETAIIGSFNALESGEEEDSNSSFIIRSSNNKLWPFLQRLYLSYKSIGDGSECGLYSSFSTVRAVETRDTTHPLRQNFTGGTVWFLTNQREHEEFFRLAPQGLSDEMHIYSPFVYRENALARIETLAQCLPSHTKLFIHTLPKYQTQLQRIVATSSSLKGRTTLREGNFHDKLIIIGKHTLCVGSFNWLSGTLNPESSHKRVEISVVLQGARAQSIIRKYFREQ